MVSPVSAADIRIEESTGRAGITMHITGQIVREDFHRLDALIEKLEARAKRAPIT